MPLIAVAREPRDEREHFLGDVPPAGVDGQRVPGTE
jgi:hypothetical protein